MRTKRRDERNEHQAGSASGTRTAQTGSCVNARSPHQLLPGLRADGAGTPTASAVLDLQRRAGNEAVQRLMAATAVQRHQGPGIPPHTHDEQTGRPIPKPLPRVPGSQRPAPVAPQAPGGPAVSADAVLSTVDVAPVISGQVASGVNLPTYGDPMAAVKGTSETGLGTATFGATTNVVRLAMASKAHDEARKDLKKATPGTVEHREAKRRYDMTAADVAQYTYGTASGLTNISANVLSVMSLPALVPAAGAAGVVSAPLAAFSTVRDTRKAVKAVMRVRDLKQATRDWDNPQRALKAQRELLPALEEKVAAMLEIKADPVTDTNPTAKWQLIAELRQAEADLDATRDEIQRLEAAKANMEAAVTAAAKGDPSQLTPELIAAYALKKNTRGVMKKALSAVSGALGLGGTIAVSVAMLAGGAALMGTPVGWALAGAAALVGIGLGIYKLVQWVRKRGKPSEREAYARKLLEFATRGKPDDQQKARELLEALGLRDLDALPGDEEKKVELIKAKLAS